MPRIEFVRSLGSFSLVLVLACGSASVDGGGPGALPGREDCGNFVDDDGDGAADCVDTDCAYAENCAGVGDPGGNDPWAGGGGEMD